MAKFDWKKLYAPKTLKIALIVFISLIAAVLITSGILALIPVNYSVEFDKNKDIKIYYYNDDVGHVRELNKSDRNAEINKIISLLEDATKSNVFNKTFGINKAGDKNVEIISLGKNITDATLKSEGAFISISVHFPSTPAHYIRLNKEDYLNPNSGARVLIWELIIQLEDIKDEWAPFSVYYKTPSDNTFINNEGDTVWYREERSYFKLNTWGNLYKLSQYIKNLSVESL